MKPCAFFYSIKTTKGFSVEYNTSHLHEYMFHVQMLFTCTHYVTYMFACTFHVSTTIVQWKPKQVLQLRNQIQIKVKMCVRIRDSIM